MKSRTIAITRGNHKSVSSEPKVWATSIERFANVLSLRNRALLETTRHEKPGSVTKLAEISERSKSNLSRTLKALSQFGIEKMKKGKRSVLLPHVPCEQVMPRLSLNSSQ